MSLEENLKTIKNAKLDIELLRRQNEKLCLENNIKINKLRVKIEDAEIALEKKLKTSGKGVPYYHTIEVVEKMKLKKAILSNELKLDEVKGIIVTPQEPKFNYKINGGI